MHVPVPGQACHFWPFNSHYEGGNDKAIKVVSLTRVQVCKADIQAFTVEALPFPLFMLPDRSFADTSSAYLTLTARPSMCCPALASPPACLSICYDAEQGRRCLYAT